MTEHIHTEENFDDIRPYDNNQFKEKLEGLVREPGFEHAVRYVMPDVNYPEFVQGLLTIQTQNDFQLNIIAPFLELLVRKTTDGLSIDGTENYDLAKSYTIITNHRDIVLDASFLNLGLIRSNLPITQVAIGNNLLIYDWITDLVKLNRSFIVKRDTGVREALNAAQHLSNYIHHAITNMHESVWIAQREGRAKDSNDLTQDSVVKMFTLGGKGTPLENLLEINLMPVSISYEYDPNDYLKVREFLLRRRDPEFHKTQRDDLFSMETGILGYKGRIHFRIGKCINEELSTKLLETRAEVARAACEIIDRTIHSNYKLFPCNYIAFDQLNKSHAYADLYSADDVAHFNGYIEEQLAKVDIPDITPEDREFMQHTMLCMYANPLRNQQISEA